MAFLVQEDGCALSKRSSVAADLDEEVGPVKRVCRYFRSKQGCRNQETCSFLHVQGAASKKAYKNAKKAALRKEAERQMNSAAGGVLLTHAFPWKRM